MNATLPGLLAAPATISRMMRLAATLQLAGPALLVAVCAIGCLFPRHVAAADASDVRQLILQAGNADSDEDRLRILRRLQAQPKLDDALRDETERLIDLVERWIHGPQLYQWFHRDPRHGRR